MSILISNIYTIETPSHVAGRGDEVPQRTVIYVPHTKFWRSGTFVARVRPLAFAMRPASMAIATNHLNNAPGEASLRGGVHLGNIEP